MAAARHRFHPTILREYDIRGVVGESLGVADAHALGRAFGTVVVRSGGRRIALGYDGRLSSAELADAAEAGLRATGLEVARIGCGPTPMLYYAIHALETDGGVMVTGSHNPPEFNGFKLAASGAAAFYGAAIRELGALAAAGDFAEGRGSGADVAVLDDYVDRLVRDYGGGRELAVAWDAGNGAAGEAMARLCARLPGRHVLLNEVIDGSFPNHHPDPTVARNLRQLQDAVATAGCEAGIAFDGDGDRIGVVDRKGRILWGDQLLMLLARDVLAARPGAAVIADVKASQVLFDEVARLGGRPIMWRTGHSLIKAKMAETGAPLGGEMSGHIFLADRYYGFDDALYAAVRLLDLLSRGDRDLAALRDGLPQAVNTPELRFPCPEARKFAVVEEVRARLRASGAELVEIDGVRVSTGDGWWLLRASNTQPVLVARCEAATAAGLERLKAALAQALAESGVSPPAM